MLAAIGKGIGDQLSAAGAITALVGTRVYHGQAPLEAALPYVHFFLSAGGSTNRTPRDELDTVWTVKAVAESAAQAASLEDAIRDALHDADLTLGAPWQAWRCQHTTAVWYIENAERRQIFHAGGSYRIRAAVA